jgi:hypothetical protein
LILDIKKVLKTGDNVYSLFRQHGTHKYAKREEGVEFKRVFATLKDSSGNMLPLAILQYFFKGDKDKIYKIIQI